MPGGRPDLTIVVPLIQPLAAMQGEEQATEMHVPSNHDTDSRLQNPSHSNRLPSCWRLPRARLSEERGFPGPRCRVLQRLCPPQASSTYHPCTISFPRIPVSCTGSSGCFTMAYFSENLSPGKTTASRRRASPDITAARCYSSIHALVDSVLEHLCNTQAVASQDET